MSLFVSLFPRVVVSFLESLMAFSVIDESLFKEGGLAGSLGFGPDICLFSDAFLSVSGFAVIFEGF